MISYYADLLNITLQMTKYSFQNKKNDKKTVKKPIFLYTNRHTLYNYY